MDKTNVMLLNEDRSLVLEICFLGYKIEDAEAYLTKHFIECKKSMQEVQDKCYSANSFKYASFL